ncbi:MAG TPA: hypothetical protein PLK61_11770 [Nitrosomonas sp.]|nr:hypothetical protein [Nitrosomonas sp.]
MIKLINNKIGSGSGDIIQRPTDNYSPLWPQYWAQNPHLRRGVGADATDAPPSDTPPAPDANATLIADLQAQLKTVTEQNELFKQKHAEAEKHRKDQEKLAAENARKAAAASGNIEALEKSWIEKFTARENELTGEITSYRGMVEELTAGQTASTICSQIAMEGCSPALMPHVRARLKSEIVDGKPVTRVLDAQGKISAMTPDDLIKELKATPYLAPLIIGSKAGGAGNPGGQGQGGVPQYTRAQWDKMSEIEKSKIANLVAQNKAVIAD